MNSDTHQVLKAPFEVRAQSFTSPQTVEGLT